MHRILAGLFSLLLAAPLHAVIVSYTFSGVTTLNFVETNSALNAEFPVGRAWTAVVEWDTSSSPLFSSATQAQYRVTSFSFTLQGLSGSWTTSAVANTSTFTTNYTFSGTRDEIQFTTAWGPANHTNGIIADFQPYSINLILVDRTGSALDSLTPAPTYLSRSDWDPSTTYTQLKFYLNNSGNRYLLGSIQSIVPTGSAVPEPSTYALLFGCGALGLALWRRRHRGRAAI